MYKKIKNKVTLVILTLVVAMNFSCETTELELLENPNRLPNDKANIDLFLNNIQLALVELLEGDPVDNSGLNEQGMDVTRILHMFGPTYAAAYTQSVMDPQWVAVYSKALPDIRAMIPLAEEQELFTHVGIAKVIESYMMTSLVDYFGDVPYSQATQPIEFPNPEPDSGAEIYAKMEILLNEAISDFEKEEFALPSNDLFYGGDKEKWIKLANTLKLRIYVQTRLVDADAQSKINAIIMDGNYITSEADDFQFRFSSTDNNPDSRHPIFGQNFDNGTTEYMSTSFMKWMVADDDKAFEDPRWRYYFYRQTDVATLDPNEQSCITQSAPPHFTSEDIFCNIENSKLGLSGFWGRIHADNDGIPPDRALRTTFGPYPVGGQADDNSTASITSRNIGLRGAGISPIMLSSFVDFMLAETALKINTEGDPRAYLEAGIRKSIAKVQGFTPAPQGTGVNITPTDDYVNDVLSLYDAAFPDEDQVMEIIAREYFIALFGNGVEAYNTYRRTGQPRLQQAEIPEPGDFIRSFFYPNVGVISNTSIDQKTNQSVKVFWDNNPDGFIN